MSTPATSHASDPKEYARAYRAKHRQKSLKASRDYYYANRQRIREQQKAKYRQVREQHLARCREYAVANRDAIAAYQKNYREKNRAKLTAYGRIYYVANAARLKRYVYERAYSSPHARVVTNCRKRVSYFIRRRQGRARSLELFGCTLPEFLDHIERQLPPGCTWNNYGRKWHVDHIMPCAAFDLRDPRQLRQCFHFTNLRPLRATDNLRKSRRITDPQFRLLL